MAAYYFGSFQINANSGGRGYFIESKPLSSPSFSPVLFPIARLGATKKSGETTNPREIAIDIKVIGSSRTDLIGRLRSLQQALFQRSQILLIDDTGTCQYQSVDCTSAEGKLGKGAIVACVMQCKFLATDPYAYAVSSSSSDTGTVALSLASSLWNFAAIDVAGGGTVYSYPLFHIVNKTSTGSTTLTTARNSGSTYTTLPVNSTSFSASVGDVLQLSSGGNTQNVTVGTAFSVGATTLAVSSFTANATYGIGATVTKITQWTAISISQTQDSQTISANSTTDTPLPSANSEYVDIQCNPIAGISIIANSSGENIDFTGVPPVIESATTTFNISIACASAVSAQCIISWNARYLS